ncbi:unnamed protein product [Effrenium voratum]|uniref:Uncharacterized protein n=1 Tax=Effrenium voratum TaxID=2562239 RepID=A0AA36IEE5_9DINO|nr:unnamed protein product [Effrenium voratum]
MFVIRISIKVAFTSFMCELMLTVPIAITNQTLAIFTLLAAPTLFDFLVMYVALIGLQMIERIYIGPNEDVVMGKLAVWKQTFDRYMASLNAAKPKKADDDEESDDDQKKFEDADQMELEGETEEMISFLATVSADSVANLVVPTFYVARRGLAPLGAGAEEATQSPAFKEAAALVVDGVEESSEEEALEWLQAGFGWTVKSRRFWRKERADQEPDVQAVKATLAWLQEKDLARKAWVKRFPEALGLSVEQLEEGKATAPSYLKSDTAYNKAIKSNPQLLGKNYDCLAEHESCQGKCSRCWNT